MADLKAADFDIPTASMNKILKSTLPENFIISKESKAAISRATGIFVFYITQAANDFARESKRSTIFPQDVVNALKLVPYLLYTAPINTTYLSDIESSDLKIWSSRFLNIWRLFVEKWKNKSSIVAETMQQTRMTAQRWYRNDLILRLLYF